VEGRGTTRSQYAMNTGAAGRSNPPHTQAKNTAGVDGVTSLTPPQRLTLTQTLPLGAKAAPVRRVWRPKPGSHALRPLGIPMLCS
jgi:retron-type reverse transcriptase